MPDTILSLAQALAAGTTTSEALTVAVLDRIEDTGGEGPRTILRLDRHAALAQARASDLLRRHGVVPSPLAGIPVTVKDLFDVAGEVTTAGSVALADAPPAAADAPVVARLRAGGAVIVGRTNMTEFAFSGLGINPHYGTPGNPFDRTRIPGGSSSGAAVSVADGMAVAAVGSDTGGSVRIPAAFCGLAGFKPTAVRVPREGTVPLSSTLDSVGPLTRTAADTALVDAVMAGEPATVPEPMPLAGLRLVVPRCHLLDGLDDTVADAFAAALERLSAAGARVEERAAPSLDRIPGINARATFAAPEAYAWHRPLLETKGDLYDPRVKVRILTGARISAADYVDLIEARSALMAETARAFADADALLVPTVAVVPPRFADLADDAAYARANAQCLRNTSAFNLLDRPVATVPCCSGGLPVGLSIVGERGQDRRVLAIALSVEPVVA